VAYQFAGDAVNVTSLATGYYTYEPTAVQYHTNRIVCIYRKDSKLYLQYSDDRGNTWSDPSQVVDDANARFACLCRNYLDGWALVWEAYTDDGSYSGLDWEIKFTRALFRTSILSKLISAGVDKGIDMAANGLKAVIAQEGHEFDFQVSGTMWENQMSSGKEIELYLGLGDNLDRRFKGFIDTVSYRDGQGTIDLSCRGRPSLLIDRKIGEKMTFSASLTYKEVIVSLLSLAGLTSAEYYVEDASVTLAEEKVFDRQDSYQSAIDRICDDIGWIVWEDEDGIIYVKSPTNYPVNLWNYFLNINCFSFDRTLDRMGVPARVVVSNENVSIEKSSEIETHGWITLDEGRTNYLATREDDPDIIQDIADKVAGDLSLKIFTIDLLVPLNFYIQVRDRLTVFNTGFDPVVSNTGIVIKVAENIDSKGMYSRLTVAMIS
jgi:hypothetical protein